MADSINAMWLLPGSDLVRQYFGGDSQRCRVCVWSCARRAED